MELTPMLKQYLEIKKQHNDAILFFRLGDFYEMFFDDAKIAAKTLEITLTKRGTKNPIPMCGIPFHAANSYIHRLVNKGYKVAICEQISDPKQKGLTKRDVVQIISPGTVAMEDNVSLNNNFLAAIYENNNNFYIATSDITTGEFFYSIFNNEDSFKGLIDELYRLNVKEIIINDDSERLSEIEKIIKNLNSNALINKIEFTFDKFFINKHFKDEEIIDENAQIAIENLLSYIHHNIKNDLGHINKISFNNSEYFMYLDANTLLNLEIIKNQFDKSKNNTLYQILDKTKTAMGGRRLKKWLEYPLLSKEKIEDRQNGVLELKNDYKKQKLITEALTEIYDFERILMKVEVGNLNPKDVIALKNSLLQIPKIKNILNNAKGKYLKNIYNNLETFDLITEKIENTIVENPPFTIKDGNFIKDEVSEELDNYRKIAKNSKAYLQEMEEMEKEKTGIKSLKIGYNKVFGYFIEVRNLYKENVPDNYIRKQTLTNAERFITEELKDFETKILGANEKISQIEYNIFNEIREFIQKFIKNIQNAANLIAKLDCINSFAIVALDNNYIKPEITLDNKILIKEGRHPIIEKLIKKDEFVPNDFVMDYKENFIHIITGPNMAGKSTYMRQVALLVLMSQVGSFIPAKFAKISIVDKIFTRIGASDNLLMGDSTFMVEMKEVSHILKNATDKSLIILDEVGRGTSTFDGMSIAKSVLDYIKEKIKGKTLFATHYHELTQMADESIILNFNIAVKEDGKNIKFLRKIIKGPCDKSYGVYVAKLAGLPDFVINGANSMLQKIEKQYNFSLDINKVYPNKETHPELLENNNKNNLLLISGNKESKDKDKILIETLNHKNIEIEKENKKLKLDNKKLKEKMKMGNIDSEVNLFSNTIKDEIKNLDLMNLTPIMAMNKLFELYNMVKED